ncbi:MAG TPA: hypothetical protein VN922_14465 [Bacteroidia bacterium]|nr:hypothetical protein [Bacteroidia bacterium]
MKAEELAKKYLALSPEEQAEFMALISPVKFGGSGDGDNDADDGVGGIQDDPTHPDA